ncbi:MAG: SUMF1/EgtB/PvdO family nonheme iron enzyme, partial [Phycisphaerales bacterium]
LHNGKSLDRSAFLNGAYDVSTFDDGPTYTDQVTRSAGAQYWIPSLDEWMKAAHYDPVKLNADGSVGGWWSYSNRSDTSPVYGPPGVLVNGRLAEANSNWSDFNYPGYNPFAVPLGAYPQTMSAYGLLDVAGGTSEWLEETFSNPGETYFRGRYFDGSPRDSPHYGADRIVGTFGSEAPLIPLTDTGFRIAAAVPSPGPGSLGVVLVYWSSRRRR